MAGEAETPAPTAKRAAQHIRLSRIDGAYEHLCVLPLLSSLAPLHLYASRYTVASRFRRRSCESSSRAPLLGPSPLRTVHASFPAHSSSPSNASLGETRFRDGNMLAMNCQPSSPARYALEVGERCGGWLAN